MGAIPGSREPSPSSTGLGPSGFDPERLETLAVRCEAATTGDRQLDGAIAQALGLPHGRASGWCNNHNGDYWVEEECAKRFTTSLDAAMTLPLDKAQVTTQNFGGPGPMALVEPNERFIRAATLPLAICAATLRAIAMETRRAETTGSVAKP